MDALQLLTADHNRVRGMFTRFEAAHESEDTESMQMLGAAIMRELEVHTTIEEELFYPAVTDLSEEIHETVVESYEEHGVAKNLMTEVQGLDPSDERWLGKLTVLMESTQHHMDEEESDLFPDVRKAMDGDALESLMEQLESRKRELGAPTLADKIDLSKAELEQRAKEQEIPGRSSMSQEELAATVAP